ncbi:MAG: 4-phosphoerythronate dehydrogenase [Bacteroidota bacterium]
MTSLRPRIVVNKHTPMVVDVFSRIGDVVALDTSEITRGTVRDADVLIVRSETPVNAGLLDGSSVKFVGTVTIGEDHIDRQYLDSRGIGFASAPGSNSTSVAEYIVAALLTYSSRFGKPLQDAPIGIVGCGNVGSKVIQFVKSLGMIPILNDPPLQRVSKDTAYRPLGELMDAEFITIHVPLTKSGTNPTHHLFDAQRLKAMKRGCVLLNTSRGPVVDSIALCSVLASQHLSSAILDVWEGEPEIMVELLDRVVIGTPHIAGYSLDGKMNALRMVYEATCRFIGEDSGGVFAPDQRVRVVAVPHQSRQENIRQVVRESYNIEFDDQLLRGIRNVAPTERATYFRKLRAEYRTRREFSTVTVGLNSNTIELKYPLQQLGFVVDLSD